MFPKKLFSHKTKLTIVSLVLHRKDKKANVKTKEKYFSQEKTFLHKVFLENATIGLQKKT